MNMLIIAAACATLTGLPIPCSKPVPITGTVNAGSSVTSTTTPWPDPKGPVNDDFIRGVCYAAYIWNHHQPMPDGMSVAVMVGDRMIECPKE